jgi:para-nitrobenzyl esterase
VRSALARWASPVLGLALLLTACQGDAQPESAPSPFVVDTAYGAVRGVTRDGTMAWRGIPYAAPPVGDLRWRAPAEPASWSGVRDASEYGHSCFQGHSSGLIQALIGPISDVNEDCLYLNVARPTGDATSLPVMVWIHGGGFTGGTGSQPVYNSPGLVRHGVVLVTLNYRLGRLGFFAHPALDDGSGERVANFGLLDQMQALQWVQANIAAFGGDPANVTIFGESAGGMSVNALMSSPRADGLFQRAVSESGLGREPSETFEQAQVEGQGLAASLGLVDPDAAALRALPADQVAGLPVDLLGGGAPVLDDVLPASVSDTFEAGQEADVPYLVGSNDLEFPDTSLGGGALAAASVRDQFLGAGRDAAIAAYGGEDELDRHLVSDVVFSEPARHLALLHAARAPTYLYRFSIVTPALEGVVGGAPHAMEIPYVFDATAGQAFVVDGAAALAATISDYWVSFAATGDPNHDGAPVWGEAGAGGLMELTVGGPLMAEVDPWRPRLDAVETAYDLRS